MSDPRKKPPSLPSSSHLPKVQISPAPPLSPTRTATLSFYGSPPPNESGPSGASPSGRANPTSLYNAPLSPTTRTSRAPEAPARATPTTHSHAGGILPPASFFKVGHPRSSVSSNKSLMNMPYGPSKAPMTKLSNTTKPTVVTRRTFEHVPAPPTQHVQPRDSIPLDQLPRPSSPAEVDVSFSLDDSMIGHSGYDSSVGGSGTSFVTRPKASREMLLPNRGEISLPPSVRSAAGAANGRTKRGSIERIFGRQSMDSHRESIDVEKAILADGLQSSNGHHTPVALPITVESTDSHSLAPNRARGDSLPSPLYPTTQSSPRLSNGSKRPGAIPLPKPLRITIPPTTPILNEKTGKPMRNYELHPSRNFFFFRGKMLTGGDSPLPFLATLTLIFGIAGVWFGCTAPYWWHHVSIAVPIVAAYMTLLSISSLMMTAMKDPGILPRDLDIEPPYSSGSPTSDSSPVPLPRDIRVRAGVVRTKWCPTCRLYRPPRSSHCRVCDNCVDMCDHHCQWVNNCVGRRNYTHFLTFLIFVSLTDIYVTITSALHLYLLTRRDHLEFHKALSTAPGSAVGFLLSAIAIWPVLTLFAYHIRLVFLNITTIEQVRNQAHSTITPGTAPPNPFTLGKWTRNVSYMFCRPAGYTWIQADEVAVQDQRRINPGMRASWKPEGEGHDHGHGLDVEYGDPSYGQ